MLTERTVNMPRATRPSAQAMPSEYNDSINRRFGHGGSRFAPTNGPDRYYIPTFTDVHRQQENADSGLYASVSGGSRFTPTNSLDRFYIPTYAEMHRQQQAAESGLYASIRDTVLAPPRMPLSQRSLSSSTNSDDSIPLYSAAQYESATVRRTGGYWTTMRRPAETPSGRPTEIAPLTPLRLPEYESLPVYEQLPAYPEETLPAYGAAETPTFV
ncbi:hypothetical protein BCR37DRAFT_316780 [Protomyces lactucae-debilis]|uniref:Uncharacterized protein n=1 Tax=Protomyces lactucae-debilis TaxID=2754530 RepID=A0A1Y2FH53_PROLT|nr:uncharacterized protein BCR37DRAFT_316780 [Protomyces lactucae-debilis]ORY82596.1 hypothetical protein BCR37DRAFT_316780 [Protomyces lactucae-debilis]